MSFSIQTNNIICENCDIEYSITIKSEKEKDVEYCSFCGEEALVEIAPLEFED